MPAFFANAVGTTSGILYHYTLPDNAINDYLVEAVAAQGTFPDLFDADGMNAAISLVQRCARRVVILSAEALIAAMEGPEFEGPKGTITIRPEDHVAMQDMYIVKLLNVDDPEFKYFELVETTDPMCLACCRKNWLIAAVICRLAAYRANNRDTVTSG